jgi:hypothetical protein
MRAYYQGPPLSNPWARVDFERHLPKQQSGNDQILGAVAVDEGAHALVATCLGGRGARGRHRPME